jgi:hypothetical protein
MSFTFIISLLLLISGCVQQQQHDVHLQLPIDYIVYPYGAAIEGQESTINPVTDNDIKLSTALATSAAEQHNSSAVLFRATSAEHDTNSGSSTATATLLSSTDNHAGASTPNRLTKNETDISADSRSTSSAELGTSSGSSTATATLLSSTDDHAGASTPNRLTKNETDISAVSQSTASAELGTNSGSSTATTTLLSSTDDHAGASTPNWLKKNETDVSTVSRSTAIAELGTSSGSSTATTMLLSSTDDSSGASDADGGANLQGGRKPADQSSSWRIATGVLVLVVTLLVVILTILMMCRSVRRCVLTRNMSPSIPGDIEMSFVTPIGPSSPQPSRESALSAQRSSEVRPSSEVIVL